MPGHLSVLLATMSFRDKIRQKFGNSRKIDGNIWFVVELKINPNGIVNNEI
jgi:hypothetical protein